MIKLNNITEKSFNNYSFNKEDAIKQINIFFGSNGSGKSALSKHLQKEYDKNEIKVFNTDYVDKNLKTANNIKGENLIIGSEQIGLSNKIKDMDTDIINKKTT